ncbi:hypothetical protein J4Q44_G00035060 [Coregonus suidteri]|uniref:Uncharacterized protein n=1 Tax=Coregonus suidteri TaxID=861788 RepID=A0AAN8R5W5_9TELE
MQYFSPSRAHNRTVHKTVDGENPMDFVVKKIEELDISRYHTKGHYRKLGSPKNDTTDDLTDNTRTAERASVRWPPSLTVLRTAGPHFRQTQSIPAHPPCITLKHTPPGPHGQGQGHPPHPPQPSAKERSKSVEPRYEPCHLDFNFLRMASTMEQVEGELQYRCAGCLLLYTSLAALQNHIGLSWMDGFSCRVFYRKLREIRNRDEPRKLHERVQTSSVAEKQLRPPTCGAALGLARGGMSGGQTGLKQGALPGAAGRKDQGVPSQRLTLESVETIRRNTVVHKWLNEIECYPIPDVTPSPEST